MLVVGLGNSSGEIAIDLWEHGARPAVAVRGPVSVLPRELLGLPILAWAIALDRLPARLADALAAPLLRLALGNLTRLGLRRPPHGPLAQIAERGQIPLIDIGTLDLIRRGGVEVWPGVERFAPGVVALADGTQRPVDAVVLATGYQPRLDAFLEGAGVDGRPDCSGPESALHGLYFCGFRVCPTGVLREIGIEARTIARSIARMPAPS